MRIIHTSDWHLGQNFMGKSRACEHQAFFRWLFKKIKKHKVDALIVSGDVYDTGSPPSYAREMFNQFVVDLQDTGCQMVVLAGNHDSVATLNESSELLSCLNTQVISKVSLDKPESQLISLKNRQGKVEAILCAIPFIRPRDVLISQAGQSGRDKQQAMQQAIADYYQQVYQLALKKRGKKKIPIIASGHLTTVGASTSDSVREIYIGTLDAFPAKAFPPVDYMALGHIHQTQKVAKSEQIRYCGSPLPLSFDEAGGVDKSVLLVDFKADKFMHAKPLMIPRSQPMQVIKGNLKQIEKQIKSLADKYELAGRQTVWLEIVVSEQDYMNDLQGRVQAMTEGLPLEVLRLKRDSRSRQNKKQLKQKETLNELTVNDVFERRLSEEDWQDKEEKARLKRIKHQFRKVVDELVSGVDSQ